MPVPGSDILAALGELPDAPVKCRTCRGILGVTNGERLQIGMVFFFKPTVIVCAVCFTVRRWQPATGLQSGEECRIMPPSSVTETGPAV